MSNAFFSCTESFPHPCKVRLPKGKPAKVQLALSHAGTGKSSFEVVLLDRNGYMESSVVDFEGEGIKSFDVPCLSTNTGAVYILPLNATNMVQEYQVTATA